MKAVVIGAGIAGLSIGWRLAQQGAEVVVLERARPGRGATWASAGIISAAPEFSEWPKPLAELAAHSRKLWPAFAEEIEVSSGLAISYREDGALHVVNGYGHRTQSTPEGGARILSGAEARSLEPLLAPDIAGATFDPTEGQVDNRALGRALATAFVRAGGRLETSETVVRLEMSGDRIVGATTPFTTHQGDAFVLAAGAWTSRIAGLPPQAMPPIIPVKGEMIALAPPAGAAVPTRIVFGSGVYLVPRHANLFIGATVAREGFDTSLTGAAAEWLRAQAARLLPALAEWDLAEHWAGLRPGSPDDMPILGETVIAGLYVAGGQFRNGILLAPAIAEALSRLVLGLPAPSSIRSFTPQRFGGED